MKRRLPIIIIIFLSSLMFFQVAQAAVTPKQSNNTGLMGYWAFDAGKGTKAVDTSGNGLTGTLTGGATWVTGKHGKALSLDGSSGYVQTVRNISDDMTICAWIKTSGVGGSTNHWQSLPIYDSETPGVASDFSFGIDSNGKLMYGNGDGTTDRSVSGLITVNTNIWTHACVTRIKSTGAIAIYVNGALDNTGTGGTTSLTSNANARIGYGYDPGKFWSGQLDEVRVYNRALTAAQISSLYQTGQVTLKQANKTGLLAEWNFDEGKGLKATDTSGSGNTGTLSGTTTPAWVNGRHGKALSFNGNAGYVNAPLLTTTTTNVSMSLWMKWNGANASSTSQGLVENGGSGSNGYALYIASGCAAGNKFMVLISGVTCSDTGYVVPTNTWVQLTLTLSGTLWTLYLNGNSIYTTTATPQIPSGTFIIGNSDSFNRPFNGIIDDVRFYNVPLSAAQVSSLYQTGQVANNVNQNSKITGGLVGYWSFNGPDMTTSTSTDVSGNGNNGTLVGGVIKTAGKVGQGLSFDGSTGYVNVGNPSALQLTSTISICAWVYPTATIGSTAGFVVAGKWDGTGVGNHRGYTLVIGGPSNSWSNTAFFINTGSTVPFAHGTTSGAIMVNKWNFLCGTYDGNNLKVYYNANNEGITANATAINNGSDNFTIGTHSDLESYFPGKIDEVRIYNRALSATEILALYAAGK